VDDGADAAGVMLKLRVVQALPLRDARLHSDHSFQENRSNAWGSETFVPVCNFIYVSLQLVPILQEILLYTVYDCNIFF
jgi:hypothetical protein